MHISPLRILVNTYNVNLLHFNFHLVVEFLENFISYMKAVCKVRERTLLLQVGTLWRYGDGLFLEVPPLASDALLTTLHPLL
jgi:hypothetical protein